MPTCMLRAGAGGACAVRRHMRARSIAILQEGSLALALV
jgi:hypothetical protein